MKIGILREIKPSENRVALSPEKTRDLTASGHEVLVQSQCGLGSGFSDSDYANGGGAIVADATSVFENAELLLKVKEPQPQEIDQLRPGQILFTFFHFAASPSMTEALIRSQATAIAYESVSELGGARPILAAMSEIAGRLAIQEGAKYLETQYGGSGLLLCGTPSVPPAEVLILGGGTAGLNAAQLAAQVGAYVTLLEKSPQRLAELATLLPASVNLLPSSEETLERFLFQADLIVSSVFIPEAAAPKIIRREHLPRMRKGAVIVDIAIDQGGSTETSRPTTHAAPTFVVDGIVHYCVANMPGVVPASSTQALTKASYPYIRYIADHGLVKAAQDNRAIANGICIANGCVTNKKVAALLGYDSRDWQDALSSGAR